MAFKTSGISLDLKKGKQEVAGELTENLGPPLALVYKALLWPCETTLIDFIRNENKMLTEHQRAGGVLHCSSQYGSGGPIFISWKGSLKCKT